VDENVGGAYRDFQHDTKDYLQIFWGRNGHFSEECSTKTPLYYDENDQIYEITLPKHAAGCLRIDPGNSVSYIQIKRIEINLYDEGSGATQRIFPMSEENGYAGIVPLHGMIQLDTKNAYSFLCINDDPQFMLDNVELHGNGRSVKFTMECKITRKISRALSKAVVATLKMDIVNSLKEEKEKLQAEKENLQAEKEELNRVNAILNKQITELFSSTSWKITAPLRKLGSLLKRCRKEKP
jgi:FtsZ-binding cell division protein ZapB